jgi:hypothetical protein
VRPGVGEDGSDYPSDIGRGNRRGLAPPERQFDAASVADGLRLLPRPQSTALVRDEPGQPESTDPHSGGESASAPSHFL